MISTESNAMNDKILDASAVRPTSDVDPLRDLSPIDQRLHSLRDCFPEVFRDGQFDAASLFDLLSAHDARDGRRAQFGLDWPGKADAIRLLRMPGCGALLPRSEESLTFSSAEHVVITGENLEVMKLLQKSYFCAFKMIYMDPPYNTGTDRIYNDDYKDSLRSYLRYSGQLTENDQRVSSLLEKDGRFHSRWLSMMLPRLFVARNLLSEDGVIFVSIDDHESHHLRMLMDDVFGSENFVCSFVWVKRYSAPPDTQDVGYVHENILCYRRSDAFEAALLPMSEEQKARYAHADDTSRGDFKKADYTCRYTAKERPTMFYPIRKRSSGFLEVEIDATFNIKTGSLRVSVKQPGLPLRQLDIASVGKDGQETRHLLEVKKKAQTFELSLEGFPRSISISSAGPVLLQWPKKTRVWACSLAVHKQNEADDLIWWPADAEVPSKKRFLKEIRQGAMPVTVLEYEEVGHTDEATKELRKWFPDVKLTPKPTRLIRHLMRIAAVQSGDYILDCFAGTGTTAEAVADANEQDDLGARFVLIQLPEPLKDDSKRTMADLARDRSVRRLKALPVAKAAGVRCFSLASSSFRSPSGEVASNQGELAAQIRLIVDNIEKGRSDEDLLFEILLKAGFRLTDPVEKIDVQGRDVYRIADGMLLICLDRKVTWPLIRALVECKPQRVVCLDAAFHRNDQLKTNAVLEMRSRGIEFRTI